MLRIALLIEYDGTHYHGWQSQKNSDLSTIQQKLEAAISQVADHRVTTVCAGRTDAKVHASGQIVHFDTMAQRTIDSWVCGTNSYLPQDIRVLSAQEVPTVFNARKSALFRTYHYFIYNSKIKPSLFTNYVTWQYKNLNIDLMQAASTYWLGEHDFSSFRGKDCQSKTAIRRVYEIKCEKQKKLIKISITANAFLKHMVRNMVGVLIKIGQDSCNTNTCDISDTNSRNNTQLAKEILMAKNRIAASITAPPEGLYLVTVGYPDNFNIKQNTDSLLFLF